jgi:hypothetical protein
MVGGLVVLAALGCSGGQSGRSGNRAKREARHPASTACHYGAGGALPDPRCTPGALNPAVTPATIGATICRRGYTATIRPRASVTAPQKRASMRRYGVGDRSPAEFEFDHLISLELGGAADSQANLWPEPRAGGEGSSAKDRVENALRARVCSGGLGLRAAQHLIATDWRRG